MTIFIVIVVIVLAGLCGVAWLLLSEKKQEQGFIEKLSPDDLKSEDLLGRVGLEPQTPREEAFPDDLPTETKKAFPNILDKIKGLIPSKKKNIDNNFSDKLPAETNSLLTEGPLKNILGKLMFWKKNIPDEEIPEATTFLSLKGDLGYKSPPENAFRPTPYQAQPYDNAVTGTASLTTAPLRNGLTSEVSGEATLSKEEEKSLDAEINQSTELSELKEKYENLEKLFSEKSQLLKKVESQLQAELNNRKEFNKVKDLLEKEIKDIKDKSKEIHSELNIRISENESYTKRINQLEEKATKLEKEALAKEGEVEKLNQTLSSLQQNQKQQKPTTLIEEKQSHSEPQDQPQIPKELPAASQEQQSKTEDVQPLSFLEAEPIYEPHAPEEDIEPKQINLSTLPEPTIEFVQTNDNTLLAERTIGEEIDLSEEPVEVLPEPPDQEPEEDKEEREDSFLSLRPDVLSEEPDTPDGETKPPTDTQHP